MHILTLLTRVRRRLLPRLFESVIRSHVSWPARKILSRRCKMGLIHQRYGSCGRHVWGAVIRRQRLKLVIIILIMRPLMRSMLPLLMMTRIRISQNIRTSRCIALKAGMRSCLSCGRMVIGKMCKNRLMKAACVDWVALASHLAVNGGLFVPPKAHAISPSMVMRVSRGHSRTAII